jgi:hypothetical protein
MNPFFKEAYQTFYPPSARDVVEKCMYSNHVGPKVNHSGKPGDENYTPLSEVLYKAGASQKMIDHVLVDDGLHWNPNLVQATTNLFTLTEKQVIQVLSNAMGPLLDNGQYSLDSKLKNGYNDHRLPHVSRVRKGSMEWARQSQFSSKEVLRRVLIASQSHDSFNPLSRKLHQHGAIEMLLFMFPEMRNKEYADQLEIIEMAMHLHTESVAKLIFDMIQIESKTQEEFYDNVLRLVGPEALCLIVNDKTDVGYHRSFNTKELNLDSLTDPHILLNFMVETKSFDVEKNPNNQHQKIAHWRMRFSPELIAARRPDLRVLVQEAQSQDILPSHEEWVKSLWQLYFDRIELVAIGAFSLFPDMSEFVISVRDLSSPRQVAKGNSHGAQEKRMVIRRQTMREDLLFYKAQI